MAGPPAMLESSSPLNVWIFSKDLARSRRFYHETLGLPLWREEPGATLHFGVGGGLLSIRAAGPKAEPPRGVFVVLPIGRTIDQVCGQLAGRGVAFELPLADRDVGRSAMLRDPDGYEIWLVRPSATETQFQRWRSSERSKTRRIPVNRVVPPRRHTPPPRSRRPRHPPS